MRENTLVNTTVILAQWSHTNDDSTPPNLCCSRWLELAGMIREEKVQVGVDDVRILEKIPEIYGNSGSLLLMSGIREKSCEMLSHQTTNHGCTQPHCCTWMHFRLLFLALPHKLKLNPNLTEISKWAKNQIWKFFLILTDISDQIFLLVFQYGLIS